MSAEKYLEGNYDGDVVKTLTQIREDVFEANEIANEVKQYQEDVKESETKRILGKKEVSEEDISSVFKTYTQDETLKQYLINNAVLKCNQASLDTFHMSDGTEIELEIDGEQENEEQEYEGREYTKLKVECEENGNCMSISESEYATIDDCKKDINISPFRCHCLKVDDRVCEYTNIKENILDCKKEGVCKYLMELETNWENLPIEGTLYKTKDTVEHIEMQEGEDFNLIIRAPCITMTSMLFCKHGGLITPVTSGQDDKIISAFKYNWMKTGLPSTEYVTIDFLQKVLEISSKLQVDPDDLMAVMAFESWFDPKLKNPKSTATGLIQIMEFNTARLGTTTAELAQMSGVEQLDYVYKYYEGYTGELENVGDVYMVTFCPKGVGKDDDYVLYTKGDGNYEVNAGLDSNNDGKITRGEAVARVLERRQKFLYE